MKPLLLLACLALAAAAGAASGLLVSPCSKSTSSEPLSPATIAPAAATIPADARKRMDQLAMEVADLQAQIAALKASSERTPAVAAIEQAKPAEIESAAAFAALHRDAILKVIADEKAEEERKREEERLQQQQQQQMQRAERVAQKLNLNAVQQRQLADFYGQERAKMEEVRAQARDSQARDSSGNGDPTAMRDSFQKLNDWRTQQLVQLFGSDLGAQIQEFDSGRGNRRGGPGGSGGPNGNGGGGGGGANRPAGGPGR